MTDKKHSEIEARFWQELQGSTVAFVGLLSDAEGDVPMTLIADDDAGENLWIFTTNDNSIAAGGPARARIMSKGQDVFIRLDGALAPERDENQIDQLWSPRIAAWYAKGRNDPDLLAMRFSIDAAEVWLAEQPPQSPTLSKVNMLLGKSKVAAAEEKHAVFEAPGRP